MSRNGDPCIVKLCAATNNSSSDEMASTTSTTTDEDADFPTFENWYRNDTSSPRYDTDHTSLVVEASSSSRSMGDMPQVPGAVMMELPKMLDPIIPSLSSSCSATPLLGLMEESATEMSRLRLKAKMDNSKISCKGGNVDRKSEGSSGMELSVSSSNQLEILNNLQAELEETRAALELTEGQLTLKMDENDEAADEIDRAWKMVRDMQTETKPIQLGEKYSRLLLHILQQIELEGGPEKAWLSQDGLQGSIVHLYMSREDVVFAKKLAQEQAEELSKRCQLLQGKLQCLTAGLQGMLGKSDDDGALIFDLEVEGEEDTAGTPMTEGEEPCHSLLAQLKTKLHSQELQAARWQMVTAQLRRELELSRQRCEAKMETLWRVEEECRRKMEDVETERGKRRKQDELIKALTAKISECNVETEQSQKVHFELEARINKLSEQLHKTLKEHEENTKCHQKVRSLEEELQIAKTTCNELWEQHQDMASNLAAKTAELEQIKSRSSNMSNDQTHYNVPDDKPSTHSDALIDTNAMQDIHRQFDQHMTLAEELESERQKAHSLRDASLINMEDEYFNERTEMSKEREAFQTGQRQQEVARQKMEEERRCQEERVQKMAESLLEVTQVRGHLTSDLNQTQHEAEVTRGQLVAATTALEYERQAKDAIQAKCSKSEDQTVQLQHQLASLQQDHQLIQQRWSDAGRQIAGLQHVQAESDRCRQECARIAAELKQRTEDLQTMERKTSVTMATKELEINARLTEGAILNSDLGRRLEATAADRNELIERVRSLEGRQHDYDQIKEELEKTKSCCEQLHSQVVKHQADLATTQASLQDITAQKLQQEADLDATQEELNSALCGQTVLRKKLRRQKAGSDSALKSLEEERDVLTNQLTEATKNLANLQQHLKSTLDAKLHLIHDKQKLTATCNSLEEQGKLDKDDLQRALCQAESLTQQLEEEKRIKNDYQEHVTESIAKLASTETTLKEEGSKVTTLTTEIFALRDTNRSQKNHVVELTGQVQDLQLELQSANHKHELQYNKLMSSSEKTISQLEKACESQEEELKNICKANHRMEAELNLLNDALAKKRSDYNRALLALHKAEMKEKEMMVVTHQLEGQLSIEKNVQDELNKSCECQEAQLQKLRKMKKNEQQNMEQLKNTMECNTKIELQHIKAELTREIFSKIETSPQKENKHITDRDKLLVQELEAELSKLKGLRSVDKLTIASLTDDVQKLQKLLAKQKGAMLHRKSHSKPRKDDIQAALAQAHVRALSMSMADSYPTVQSPLFDTTGLFESKRSPSKRVPDYGSWETKSSDSVTTCSSDEYSS